MLSPRGSLSGNGLLSSVLREGAVFISVRYTEGSDTTSYVQMLVTYKLCWIVRKLARLAHLHSLFTKVYCTAQRGGPSRLPSKLGVNRINKPPHAKLGGDLGAYGYGLRAGWLSHGSRLVVFVFQGGAYEGCE